MPGQSGDEEQIVPVPPPMHPPLKHHPRSVEPFIWVPPPRPGWQPMRVRAIHDVVVLVVGSACIIEQLVADLFLDRDPHYWILAFGATLLGYRWAVSRDRKGGNGNGSG